MELFGQKPYWKEERATDSTKWHHWIPMDGSRSEQQLNSLRQCTEKRLKQKRPRVRLRTVTEYTVY